MSAFAWVTGDDGDEPGSDDEKLAAAEIELGTPDQAEYESHPQHVKKCGLRYQITQRTIRSIKRTLDRHIERQRKEGVQIRLILVGIVLLILITNPLARDIWHMVFK